MLLADPANGLARPLYYPKMPVEARSGLYSIELAANRDPGVHKGRFLLVSANSQASAVLQKKP